MDVSREVDGITVVMCHGWVAHVKVDGITAVITAVMCQEWGSHVRVNCSDVS